MKFYVNILYICSVSGKYMMMIIIIIIINTELTLEVFWSLWFEDSQNQEVHQEAHKQLQSYL